MPKTNVRGGQIADGSNGIDLGVDVTGILSVPNGGTGKLSATINSLITGNGTAAYGEIAPGAAGEGLISDGSEWVSAPVAAPNYFSLDGGTPSTSYVGTLKIDFGGVT